MPNEFRWVKRQHLNARAEINAFLIKHFSSVAAMRGWQTNCKQTANTIGPWLDRVWGAPRAIIGNPLWKLQPSIDADESLSSFASVYVEMPMMASNGLWCIMVDIYCWAPTSCCLRYPSSQCQKSTVPAATRY